MPMETYPASQNDLCYKGIYTGVLGSNRWSGCAAAISIFRLVCEIIHIVLQQRRRFLSLKVKADQLKGGTNKKWSGSVFKRH